MVAMYVELYGEQPPEPHPYPKAEDYPQVPYVARNPSSSSGNHCEPENS